MERDSNLADKFRKGNLDGLYDEMYRPLLLYATKCLTDRFSFLAEDCVQDAILRAFRLRDSFGTVPELRSYLYTAVHGKAVDILRKGSSKEKYVQTVGRQSEDILSGIIENEAMERLFQAVKKLSEQDRDLFFDYFDGMKTSEIALKLGISEGAVKQRKSTMISRLQKEMDDKALVAMVMLIPMFCTLS